MLVVVKRFVLFAGLWLVLTGNDPGAWLVGLLATAAAVVVSLRLLPPGARRLRLGVAVALLPGFAVESLRGGIDVARRAFHPRVPVEPAWIEYPLRLPRGPARVSLGNLLSLMPGTLAAGERNDALYIHCLDATINPKIAREEDRIGRSIGIDMDADNG